MQKIILTGLALAVFSGIIAGSVVVAHGQTTTTPTVTPAAMMTTAPTTAPSVPGTPNTGRGN